MVITLDVGSYWLGILTGLVGVFLILFFVAIGQYRKQKSAEAVVAETAKKVVPAVKKPVAKSKKTPL